MCVVESVLVKRGSCLQENARKGFGEGFCVYILRWVSGGDSKGAAEQEGAAGSGGTGVLSSLLCRELSWICPICRQKVWEKPRKALKKL